MQQIPATNYPDSPDLIPSLFSTLESKTVASCISFSIQSINDKIRFVETVERHYKRSFRGLKKTITTNTCVTSNGHCFERNKIIIVN